MNTYAIRRVSTLAIIGKFAIALIAVVLIQGILSFKFKVFGYFDLPLVCCVYYGFTIANPIASIVIGSSLGLMQDSLSGAVLGANGLSKIKKVLTVDNGIISTLVNAFTKIIICETAVLKENDSISFVTFLMVACSNFSCGLVASASLILADNSHSPA